MSSFAVALAAAAAAAMLLPGDAWLLSLGLAIGAIGAGANAYRRRGPGSERLHGAAAVAAASIVLALGATKVGVTLVAINRMAASL